MVCVMKNIANIKVLKVIIIKLNAVEQSLPHFLFGVFRCVNKKRMFNDEEQLELTNFVNL